MTDTKPKPVPHEHLKAAGESAWEAKEHGVRIDDDFDITPHVQFYRSGEIIAVFIGARVNKFDGIAIVHMGASLLDADEAVITMDTHVTSTPNNPKTGKPWAHGEMQALCNDEGACETGIITDAIFSMRIGKDLPISTLQRKYHVNHTFCEVHWVESDGFDTMDEADSGCTMQGFIPDSMRKAWGEAAMPSLPDDFEVDLTDLERECIRFTLGIKLICLTVGGAGIPLLHGDSEVAGQIYKEFLSQEAMQEFHDGPMGTLLVPLLRERFGLDQEA